MNVPTAPAEGHLCAVRGREEIFPFAVVKAAA
jgi:hypothetical protein